MLRKATGGREFVMQEVFEDKPRVKWGHPGYKGPVRLGRLMRDYPSHVVVRWDNGELQAYGRVLVERGFIVVCDDQTELPL